MEFLMDPAIWVALLTLLLLVVVPGIDNLVFIAIQPGKLAPQLREPARLVGLSLVMRLGLLLAIWWMATLAKPIFSMAADGFSGRDLIVLIGGLFLVLKAIMEFHARLERPTHHAGPRAAYVGLWMVVALVVILDAVLSLDAVITAVGVLDQLGVMLAAVAIAMGVVIIASKLLPRFGNKHPAVLVLCLSLLLMIGFSLLAKESGWHIPSAYLYAALGLWMLIETFKQISRRNRMLSGWLLHA